MDVDIFFCDGTVENHSIPPLVGRTQSNLDQEGGIEESFSDLDTISDIVDIFIPDPDGYRLERVVRHKGGDCKHANGTLGQVIVTKNRIQDVEAIFVDGTEVDHHRWPA